MSANIRIDQDTKKRLDRLKGCRSYNLMIAEMLRNFEQTGIAPSSRMVYTEEMMKIQSNRIIEVLKDVEKRKSSSMDEILKLLERISTEI